MSGQMLAFKQKKKIFLIDDNKDVRYELKKYINLYNDFNVCGETENTSMVLNNILELKPDLIIMDISLKSGRGIDLIKRINILFPSISILVLSMHSEYPYYEKAIQAGASGFVTKPESISVLIKAIRKLLSGNTFISTEIN